MSSAQFFVAKGLQELVNHNLPIADSNRPQTDKDKKIQKYV